MQKMSPIPIAINIRAGRIPVRWTVREGHWPEVRDVDSKVLTPGGSERVFWPEVIQKNRVTDLTEIEDPLDLRAQLFKAFNSDWCEAIALDFLSRAGAWRAVKRSGHESHPEGRVANIAYGHRLELELCVLPVTLDELRTDVERWYKLLGMLSNPTKLRAEFKPPPAADSRPYDVSAFAWDAHFNNTLRVSLEWQGKDPRAVVETITAWELMVAAAWADVVGRAEEQVCANPNCGTRFTCSRKKKYCRWECGHLVAVRTYKRKQALKLKQETLTKKARRQRARG